MNNSSQNDQFIHPIDHIERNHLPKGIKLAAVIVGGGLALAGCCYLIFLPKDQNLESQEPILEYSGANSRVAGIQFLLSQGLTFEQYTAVYQELTETFSRIAPSAAYFDYVPDSVSFERGQNSGDAELSDEEIAAILSKLSDGGDHTVTSYSEADSGKEEQDEEGEGFDAIVFKMSSDAGEEYTVRVEPNGDLKTVSVEIYNSGEEKVN